jgi:hypothetical protein
MFPTHNLSTRILETGSLGTNLRQSSYHLRHETTGHSQNVLPKIFVCFSHKVLICVGLNKPIDFNITCNLSKTI